MCFFLFYYIFSCTLHILKGVQSFTIGKKNGQNMHSGGYQNLEPASSALWPRPEVVHSNSNSSSFGISMSCFLVEHQKQTLEF